MSTKLRDIFLVALLLPAAHVFSQTNLALNKTVTVSSTEFPHEGLRAVDGNATTRWASNVSDPQWIYVDLGSSQAIDRVKITWEAAMASNYLVQTSPDASAWATVKTVTGNSATVNDHTALGGTGRYVRVYGTTRATAFGYSIFELEVYGSAGCASPAPTVTPGSRCGTGTVTLSASRTTTGVFRWYTALTGGTALRTSASVTSDNYTTASISATTTYYVTFHNGTCESTPRTAIVATVNAVPATPTGTAGSRCGAGTVTLSASSATAGTFVWYSASTGGTVLRTSSAGLTADSYTTASITATTNYFVSVRSAANCEGARRSVTATINAVPAAPTVTAGSTCGPGIVTLAANSATAGTFKWYDAATAGNVVQTSATGLTTNNFTTPSLSVTTTYYVTLTNSVNCESATRTAVTATVSANSPAVQPTVTNRSRCGTGTVQLTATSATSGTFRWYNALTGGTLLRTSGAATTDNYTTPSISATTIYYVTFNNGTCESTPRRAVTATINSAAVAPVATAGSRCSTGTVALSATSTTAGTFKWYAALTGGTALRTSPAAQTTDSYTTTSISTTTTYYVTFTNASNCESTSRTAVSATVNAFPAAPTATGASRCDVGTVALSASSATAGTFLWYAAATGGTALQTSAAGLTTNSFTTPSLSASVTYYVTINNGLCESTPRTAVAATINPIPATFEVTGGGMYTPTVQATVNLTGSAVGTTYQLLLNGANSGVAINGTGSALSWSVSTAGTYTVVTTGACSAAMSGSAKVQDQQSFALDALSFQYRYDGRRRMIQKKVPGAEWVYMVYDQRDRLVMTQDGEQRKTNKWTFTKYDPLNRPVVTGLYNTGTTVVDQPTMQANVDTYYNQVASSSWAWFETFSTSGSLHGYDNKSYPNTNLDVLTVTYYDNYDFKTLYGSGYDYGSDNLSATPLTNVTYTQPVTANNAVIGQVTGSKVKMLDGIGTWLKTVSYVDEKYRVIQTISDNIKGGIDRSSTLYDFVGKALKTKTTHATTASTGTIARTFDYDHAGRLLKTWHSINGTAPVLLAQNEYNELGQLVAKNLHNTDPASTPDANRQYKQTVDYRYNIRGWLTKVNDATTPTPGDFFSMDLNYNNPTTIGVAAQYNGNISETLWRGSDGRMQSYGYAYDPMNRLTEAKYYNQAMPLKNGRFDEKIWDVAGNTSGYDLNGNIRFLTRVGRTGATVAGVTTYGSMDNLSYTYRGNQLLKVDDSAIKTEGFREGATTGNDYSYDANGNMTLDRNKDISIAGAEGAILYNHLNLPEQVTKSNGDYVKYIYDATGRKLRQEVYLAGQPAPKKKSEYAGEYMYENDTLKFINHEEGRVVTQAAASQPSFTLQYPLNGNMVDTSDKALNGTLQGGYTLATDRKGNQAAVQFNGTDGFGSIPNSPDLDFKDGDFSVSFWVKKLQSTISWSNASGVGKWNTGGSPGTNSWSLGLAKDANSDVPGFAVEIGNTYYMATATTSLALGQWYHLVGTKEKGMLKIYVNGVLEGSLQLPGTNFKVNQTPLPIYVGRVGGGAFTNAVYDDIQINNGFTPEYQYHLKDHLGNVRLTFTTKDETDINTATMETANAPTEQGQFLNYSEAIIINASIFDRTHRTPDGLSNTTFYSTRLTGGTTNAVNGLAKSLSVMPGDKVDVEVFAKYLDPNSTNWSTALANFMASIVAGGGAPAGTIIDGNFPGSLGNNAFPFPGQLVRNGDNGTGPKAYLNYLLFDRDYVYKTGGFKRLTTAAIERGSDVTHERLFFDNNEINITEAGYLYVWLSNENDPPVEVYFDDFKVVHTKSPVVQTDDYYPFGLAFNSYSRENSTPNQYKFNGKEEQDELDLGLYDYLARQYDPALGRFTGIDPAADLMRRFSPYVYAFDNPVRFTDPDGMIPFDGVRKRDIFEDDPKNRTYGAPIHMDHKPCKGCEINGNGGIQTKEYEAYASRGHYLAGGGNGPGDKSKKPSSGLSKAKGILIGFINGPIDLFTTIGSALFNQAKIIANEGIHEGGARDKKNSPLNPIQLDDDFNVVQGKLYSGDGGIPIERGVQLMKHNVAVLVDGAAVAVPIKIGTGTGSVVIDYVLDIIAGFGVKTPIKTAIKKTSETVIDTAKQE